MVNQGLESFQELTQQAKKLQFEDFIQAETIDEKKAVLHDIKSLLRQRWDYENLQSQVLEELESGERNILNNISVTNDELVDLRGIQIQGQVWKNLNLEKIDFSYGIIDDSTFDHCNFQGSKFRILNIISMEDEYVAFLNCDFSHTRLSGSKFDSVLFDGSIFEHSIITSVFNNCSFASTKGESIALNQSIFLFCHNLPFSSEQLSNSHVLLLTTEETSSEDLIDPDSLFPPKHHFEIRWSQNEDEEEMVNYHMFQLELQSFLAFLANKQVDTNSHFIQYAKLNKLLVPTLQVALLRPAFIQTALLELVIALFQHADDKDESPLKIKEGCNQKLLEGSARFFFDDAENLTHLLSFYWNEFIGVLADHLRTGNFFLDDEIVEKWHMSHRNIDPTWVDLVQDFIYITLLREGVANDQIPKTYRLQRRVKETSLFTSLDVLDDHTIMELVGKI
ncbi:MAG: hypothetical protein ACI86H_001388 [bacterium]|jgi:uncharacterized protein YjbI with pentapeptide repeats